MNKIHSILLAAIIGLMIGAPKTEAQNHPATVSPGLYMGLNISGAVGTNYVVQCINDVAQSNNWQTVDAFALPNSPHLWIDTNGTATQRRFYRVIEGGGPFVATVTLSGLNQAFDGTAKSVTVTTEPPKLSVAVTYDGLSSPPVNVGRYQVVATVTDGYYFGTATNTLEITVPAQAISFRSLAVHTYGDIPIDLSATASSGLPVSFQSDNTNVALINGSTVMITGAGTANIIATQPGNANFAAAPPVTNSLTVSKSVLTVMADDKTKAKGEANPVLTATFTGFVNGETVAMLSGAPELSTAAATNSPAGMYPITVTEGTLSAANYGFNFVSGTLIITSTNPNPSLLVWIPPGTFVMGSPESEVYGGSANGEMQHTVTLTEGFYMSKYLVRQGDYLSVMGSNPSYFSTYNGVVNTNLPVECVSWYDAANYCALLTQREQAAGRLPAGWAYRLPTLAEGEYACRAGTTTAFYFGNAIYGTNANFNSYYEYDAATGDIYEPSPVGYIGQTTPVGSYLPNPWGLYDMSGNVFEWCLDWNISVSSSGDHSHPRIRGGSWSYSGSYCRSALFGSDLAGTQANDIGFRPVVAFTGPSQSISFPSLAASTYGDIPIDLGAAASSGLPVSFQSDNTNVALINGSTVTITGAGTANIIATQPGNASFAAAPPVNNRLIVNKAVLTVMADDKNKVKGEVNPVLTATFRGFVNEETITVLSGAPDLSTTATTNSPTGTYPITVAAGTLSAANYEFSFEPGILDVAPIKNPNPALLVWIHAGTFVMGSPDWESWRYSDVRPSDEMQHRVTMTKGYYMSKYLVRQGEYSSVVGSNPSMFREEKNLPVEMITWYEAADYCAKLTQREQLAGRLPDGWGYRLPTEAEWEYACRAGTTTAFYFGNAILGGDANFYSYYEFDATWGYTYQSRPVGYVGQTSPVGSYEPNPWGLYDMCGNVWEWCQDWLGKYPTWKSVSDPLGAPSGTNRVLRGGSWNNYGASCRSARRGNDAPGNWGNNHGFRVILAQTSSIPANPDPSVLAWIPAGTFMMGSPDSEVYGGAASGENQHTVTLTMGFYMGKYLVRQGEYLSVIGNNPSSFSGDTNLPVEMVSWYDASDYCAKLTQREQLAERLPEGWVYRLPTEAEWEYACRAGTTTAFYFGSVIRDGMANFDSYLEYDAAIGDIFQPIPVEHVGQATPVGTYEANPWGLYDMCGNVFEWCLDWYDTYPTGSASDPVGPGSGSTRVLRGGVWDVGGKNCRSAARDYKWPGDKSNYVGFRMVLAPGQP